MQQAEREALSVLPSPSRPVSWLPFVVFAAFFALYAATGCWRFTAYNAHVHLAQAMLHGHFDLTNPPGYFEMAQVGGRHFIAYGIGPTLMMLPLVAIWGLGFHQALFSAAVSAWAVALWWSILGQMKAETKARIALTLMFGMGSLFWYYGGQNGNTWTIMHTVTIWGLMLAIWETLGKQRGWIVGLGFGLAVLSRQAALLSLPFFLVLLWQDRSSWRKLAGFGLGFGALMAFGAYYNFARFGSPFDNGYEKVVYATAPAYMIRYGLFSFHYLMANLQGYFLRLPPRVAEFPFFDPTLDGFTIFLSLPALLVIYKADYRQRLNLLALFSCLAIQGLYLVYHGSGYAQFGKRYAIDYLPFAMVLIASALKSRLSPWLVLATAFGSLVEVWGLYWWRLKGW